MTTTEVTSTTRSASQRPKPAADHFVQFYERDETLAESLARYLRNGLETGAAAIMIATPEHVEQVLDLWRSQGFDPAWARERGQMIILDAAGTLASLCRDGSPAADLFAATIEPLIVKARRFGHVVAFGEMVGLLWAEGKHEEAVHLETLWNMLLARHPFALYCAYRMADCAIADGTGSFRAACDAHSHIMPAENIVDLDDDKVRVRLLAELQQRSAALQREVESRMRAERELADFLDNAVVGLHRVGPDGTILWANDAELSLLGYSRDEYVGHNIAEFHDDPPVLERILDRLSSGDSLRDVPARLRCKDGTIRHVLISSNALIRDGKLVHTRCFTRDVSDRWLAQEALRERGAVLHLAMQGARMGYWVADLEHDSMRGSAELASHLGLSGPFDWSLDEFLALVHPHDRRPFRVALEAAIHGRREFLVEFRVRTDTLTWRWFEGRGEAVYNDRGDATRFYGVCMDVTSRKRTEEQLAHMAAVVDSADDAIVSKTLDGIVKSWNGGAKRIFGYEPEEMIGRPITVIIPPDLHHEEAGILAKIRAGQRVEHYVTTRVAKDGSLRKVSITVSPVRNAAGEIIGASKIGRVVA